jgi:hypothetical protein
VAFRRPKLQHGIRPVGAALPVQSRPESSPSASAAVVSMKSSVAVYSRSVGNQARMSQAVSNTGRTLADGCTGAFHARHASAGGTGSRRPSRSQRCLLRPRRQAMPERLRLGPAATAARDRSPWKWAMERARQRRLRSEGVGLVHARVAWDGDTPQPVGSYRTNRHPSAGGRSRRPPGATSNLETARPDAGVQQRPTTPTYG